ncbi:MAG TPA: 50S ribosomal protein L3 N(5)-glutamine methyltransferase [Candidatus Binatia bacterium]|nr:50S ribosomal protein L3 N(5)-glutamine methyltransferase [Candidatus Binatia bacterium]
MTAALRTIRDLVRWGASEFGRAGLHFGHGTDNALDESFYLVTWALHLPHDVPATYLDAVPTPAERRRVLTLLKRRVRTRQPAAYLTGTAWFAGLEFEVDARVLVPRSPIAELVEAGFAPWCAAPPRRILDLGAGSGCIAIACAHFLPQAQVDAGELDAGALEVLRRNIARHGMAGRVRAVRSDLFAALRGRRYDLIVTNPPYVPLGTWKKMPAEYHREPKRALAAGTDGLDLVDRILREAPDRLASGGVLIGEVGGTMPLFLQRYPDLPAIWPEFERGGDGVFVVTRDELVRWRKGKRDVR